MIPDGSLSLSQFDKGLRLTILPQVRILVFGTGMETVCFAELAQASGCLVELFTSDPDILTRVSWSKPLFSDKWPEDTLVDERSAVVTFFHDHDREIAILSAALVSPAFFVGAQGSRRAHASRCEALLKQNGLEKDIEKLIFPLGLIPSTRDPQTLAVSVLAHILDHVTSTSKAFTSETSAI